MNKIGIEIEIIFILCYLLSFEFIWEIIFS